MNRMLLALSLWVLVGCDVVPSDAYTQPYHPENGSSERNVLLEEYTGTRCVNCPAATDQARLLEQTYGDRLITVSLHAGGFASPSGIFIQDLRTEAGTTYFDHFGFVGTPMGCVNRSEYRSALGLSPSLWGAAIDAQLLAADEIKMETSVDFDPQQRVFTLLHDVQRLDGASAVELSLTVWLVEDSISAPQVTPLGVDQNYMQRHVVRGALNGTWGEVLDFSDAVHCSVAQHYTLPPHFDAAHCSVVSFVSERSSLRVLQAIHSPLDD